MSLFFVFRFPLFFCHAFLSEICINFAQILIATEIGDNVFAFFSNVNNRDYIYFSLFYSPSSS